MIRKCIPLHFWTLFVIHTPFNYLTQIIEMVIHDCSYHADIKYECKIPTYEELLNMVYSCLLCAVHVFFLKHEPSLHNSHLILLSLGFCSLPFNNCNHSNISVCICKACQFYFLITF